MQQTASQKPGTARGNRPRTWLVIGVDISVANPHGRLHPLVDRDAAVEVEIPGLKVGIRLAAGDHDIDAIGSVPARDNRVVRLFGHVRRVLYETDPRISGHEHL